MGTTYGSMAAYSCSIGYKLTGSLTTQCEQTGIWNPPDAPTCVVIGNALPNLGPVRILLCQNTIFDVHEKDGNSNQVSESPWMSIIRT